RSGRAVLTPCSTQREPERRPALCAALYEDLWRSRFGEEDATNKSAYPLPVWGVRDGKFTSHYSRTYVEAAQRQPESEVPRVSDRQWQALNLLAKLAEELCFEMSFAPGDIQFVNNHVIYHARSAFEDDDDGHGPAALASVAVDAEQPRPPGWPRGAVAHHRGRRRARRHRSKRRPGVAATRVPDSPGTCSACVCREAAGSKSPARPFCY